MHFSCGVTWAVTPLAPGETRQRLLTKVISENSLREKLEGAPAASP